MSEVSCLGCAQRDDLIEALQKRIEEYRRNGGGEPVAHWGGRYIWQLEDRDDLLVAWNVTNEDPAVVESRMLDHFVGRYGVLPFANLRR